MELSPQLLDGVAAHLGLSTLVKLADAAPRLADLVAPRLRGVADRFHVDDDHEHRCFAVRYWRLPEALRVELGLPQPDDPPPARPDQLPFPKLSEAAMAGDLSQMQQFFVAAERGHFKVCQWLLATCLQPRGLATTALGELCRHGASRGWLPAVQWVLPQVTDPRTRVQALVWAITDNQPDVAAYLLRALNCGREVVRGYAMVTFPPPVESMLLDVLVLSAASCGYWEVLLVVLAWWGQPTTPIRVDGNAVLGRCSVRDVAALTRHPQLQLVYNEFSFVQHVGRLGRAMRHPSSRGLCRWVARHVGPFSRWEMLGAVGAAACNGHLDNIVWLVRHFGLHDVDVLREQVDAVARGGHVPVCQWLASHTACTKPLWVARHFLCVAAEHRRLGACVWAVQHWRMTVADISGALPFKSEWRAWLAQFVQ